MHKKFNQIQCIIVTMLTSFECLCHVTTNIIYLIDVIHWKCPAKGYRSTTPDTTTQNGQITGLLKAKSQYSNLKSHHFRKQLQVRFIIFNWNSNLPLLIRIYLIFWKRVVCPHHIFWMVVPNFYSEKCFSLFRETL